MAVGAMYKTISKEKAVVVGPERLRQIREAVSIPLVAIGGVDVDNIAEVIGAGADSVAVISAVLTADSPETAARCLVDKFEVSE